MRAIKESHRSAKVLIGLIMGSPMMDRLLQGGRGKAKVIKEVSIPKVGVQVTCELDQAQA